MADSYHGNDCGVAFYHLRDLSHLTRLGYAHLNDTCLRRFRGLAYRYRDPDLGICISLCSVCLKARVKGADYHFPCSGLADGSRDAYIRDMHIIIPVIASHALQGLYSVIHPDQRPASCGCKNLFRKLLRGKCRFCPVFKGLGYKSVTIDPGAYHRYENTFCPYGVGIRRYAAEDGIPVARYQCAS